MNYHLPRYALRGDGTNRLVLMARVDAFNVHRMVRYRDLAAFDDLVDAERVLQLLLSSDSPER